MGKHQYLLLFVTIWLLFIKPAQADTLEIAGADISYLWIGDDKCQVKLNLYTVCNAPRIDSVWIKISSPDKNFTSYKKQVKLQDMGELDYSCNFKDPAFPKCNNLSDRISFRKWTAMAEFTISNKDFCEYIFSWEACCRTNLITTGAAGNHFYIDAYMQICDGKISQPQFLNDPEIPAYVHDCNEKPNPVDLQPRPAYYYDKFDITTPKKSKDSVIDFKHKYSYDKPFFYSETAARQCSGLRISNSGVVSFETFRKDNSVVAFNLSTYTVNGVLIGRTTRDIIYILQDLYENEFPVITGLSGTANTEYKYIAGENKCFTIHAFDGDKDDDSVSMSAQNIPVGAEFKIHRDKWPEATFCWTPKLEDSRKEPYIVTIKATDHTDGCGTAPLEASSEKEFKFYVCPNIDCYFPFNVYPNPAQNTVYVQFNEVFVNSFQLTDIAGRIFFPDYNVENNGLSIDVQNLRAGCYMLKLVTDQNIYYNKVIIQR